MDKLYGGAGNDYLFGGYGVDQLYGGADNDVLAGGDDSDFLFGGSGDDIMAGDFGQSTYLDGTLVVYGDDYMDGGEGNDTLFGDGGNDTLLGGSGDDALHGGAGNDTYVFNQGDGQDTIWDTGAEVGDMDTIRFGTGVSSADVSFSRVAYDLVIQIKGSADRITVKNWGKNLAAQIANIVFEDGTVWDTAFVNKQVQALPIAGTEFDDNLSAWIGEPMATLTGGPGNDTYFVLHSGDVVQEAVNGGYDTVVSTVDYTLGENVEALTLVAGAVAGNGNSLSNTIRGNSSDNVLSGGAGDDVLLGEAGNDYLDGGVGNDTLIGGTGRDTYSLKLGSGQDRIELDDDLDAIVFGAGITQSSLVATRTADGMLLKYGNAGDVVTISGGTLHEIRLADGTRLTMDQVFAGQSGFTVAGSGNDDFLQDTSAWARHFEGGRGNDVMMGGAADTEYRFSRGDGQDSIVDLGGQDTLSFGDGISVDDVWFSTDFTETGPSFKVHYGAGDVVSIAYGSQGSIENYRFADGTVLSFADMLSRQHFVVSPDPVDGRNIPPDWSSGGSPTMVVGTAGDDLIDVTNGHAGIYIGGKGNDRITIRDNDGESLSTVLLGLGDGSDYLIASAKTRIQFGSGIDPNSLRFSQVLVQNYYSTPFGHSGWRPSTCSRQPWASPRRLTCLR